MDKDLRHLEQIDLSLLETLDHVLNRGLVIAGEITISVADIDLIFVGLNVLLGSVETIHEVLGRPRHGNEFTPPSTSTLPAQGTKSEQV